MYGGHMNDPSPTGTSETAQSTFWAGKGAASRWGGDDKNAITARAMRASVPIIATIPTMIGSSRVARVYPPVDPLLTTLPVREDDANLVAHDAQLSFGFVRIDEPPGLSVALTECRHHLRQ